MRLVGPHAVAALSGGGGSGGDSGGGGSPAPTSKAVPVCAAVVAGAELRVRGGQGYACACVHACVIV